MIGSRQNAYKTRETWPGTSFETAFLALYTEKTKNTHTHIYIYVCFFCIWPYGESFKCQNTWMHGAGNLFRDIHVCFHARRHGQTQTQNRNVLATQLPNSQLLPVGASKSQIAVRHAAFWHAVPLNRIALFSWMRLFSYIKKLPTYS